MTPQTFRVTGMTCGGCARHVEKAARATPGVVEAAVDLAAGTLTVMGEVDAGTLSGHLAEAGYTMAPSA